MAFHGLKEFRVVCRSIVINPDDGSVFLTHAEGDIICLKYGANAVETVEGEDMRKDC